MLKLYLLIWFVISIHTSHSRRQKMVKVDRFELCYKPENPPYKVHYFDLTHLPDMHYSFSGAAESLEEMHAEDLDFEIHIEKCRVREHLDSCEPLPTYRPPTSPCNLLQLKELGIREATNKVVPPLRCPIQKINYSVTDIRYSLDKFTLFPVGNNYWKGIAHGYFKKRLVGSLCIELQTFDMTMSD